MAMAMGPARAAQAGLMSALLLAAMAITAAGVSAAPAPGFTLSAAALSFSAYVGSSDTQDVTVTTGRKAVALDLEFFHGYYTDSGTGTCMATYQMQVPANSSCTITVAFTPLVSGSTSTTMAITQCLKWTLVGGTVQCDRSHVSDTVNLSGDAFDVP